MQGKIRTVILMLLCAGCACNLQPLTLLFGTPTATSTLTFTPSQTFTASATITPSPTRTPRPTRTFTPTPSSTRTPTPGFTIVRLRRNKPLMELVLAEVKKAEAIGQKPVIEFDANW